MLEKSAVELFGMKVAHVGINATNEAESAAWAKEFLELMGLPTRETSASKFCGELVEIMNENGRGVHGHIGFTVNNMDKALEYFSNKGMTPVEETKKFDENGKCWFTYFKEQIGGFAIHIVRE